MGFVVRRKQDRALPPPSVGRNLRTVFRRFRRSPIQGGCVRVKVRIPGLGWKRLQRPAEFQDRFLVEGDDVQGRLHPSCVLEQNSTACRETAHRFPAEKRSSWAAATMRPSVTNVAAGRWKKRGDAQRRRMDAGEDQRKG